MTKSLGASSSSGHGPAPYLAAGAGGGPEIHPHEEGFRIGPWWVEPSTGRLRHRDGDERQLRPQEMDLLSCLASGAGRVVSREEILAEVWYDAEVEEGAISRCVSVIRKALGDEARSPRYIETIPKRGYRLIQPVERAPQERAPADRERGRRRLPVLGGLLLLAAVFAVAAILAATRPEPGPDAAEVAESALRGANAAADDRTAVAVLGFANLSGAEEVDWLSTALAEMLATELASTDDLQVVAGETVALMKRDLSLSTAESLAPETLRRVRVSLGAERVVLGSYLARGGARGSRLRLDLKLQDTASGEIVSGLTEIGSLDRLAEMVATAGVRLRERLGAAPPDRSWTAPASHLPEDTEAVRLYAEGLGKLRRFEAAAARDLLLDAVAREPRQPLAHLALAQAWGALGYEARAVEAARRAHAQAADLPRELELWVEATYLASLRRWDDALELYNALWVFAPQNLEYALRLAETQNAASRPGDALDTVRRIHRQAEPGHRDPRLALVTAEAARLLGDHGRSLAATASAIDLGDTLQAPAVVARGRYLRALALHSLGRFPEATIALEEARAAFAAVGDRRNEAGAQRVLAGWLAARGSYHRARDLAIRSLEVYRAVGDRKGEAASLGALSQLQWRTGEPRAAEALLRQAMEIYRETHDKSGEAGALRGLGILAGSARRLREADALFGRALAIYRELGTREQVAWVRANLGKLHLLATEPAEAESHLREAEGLARELELTGLLANVRFNQGYTGWLIGDPLRGEAAFSEAIDLYRRLENPLMVAASFQGLGETHLLRGDLEAARTCLEVALARRLEIVREEGGHGTSAMESRAVLSVVLLEQGDLEAAEIMARRAVEADRAPLALTALSRTLLAQHRVADAGRLTAEAERKPSGDQRLSDVELRRRILAARIQAAAGDPGAARELLATVITDARERGAWTLYTEAELSLGEIELDSGDRRAGAARLAAIERDARARGIRLFAEKARQARKGAGSSTTGDPGGGASGPSETVPEP